MQFLQSVSCEKINRTKKILQNSEPIPESGLVSSYLKTWNWQGFGNPNPSIFLMKASQGKLFLANFQIQTVDSLVFLVTTSRQKKRETNDNRHPAKDRGLFIKFGYHWWSMAHLNISYLYADSPSWSAVNKSCYEIIVSKLESFYFFDWQKIALKSILCICKIPLLHLWDRNSSQCELIMHFMCNCSNVIRPCLGWGSKFQGFVSTLVS